MRTHYRPHCVLRGRMEGRGGHLWRVEMPTSPFLVPSMSQRGTSGKGTTRLEPRSRHHWTPRRWKVWGLQREREKQAALVMRLWSCFSVRVPEKPLIGPCIRKGGRAGQVALKRGGRWSEKIALECGLCLLGWPCDPQDVNQTLRFSSPGPTGWPLRPASHPAKTPGA